MWCRILLRGFVVNRGTCFRPSPMCYIYSSYLCWKGTKTVFIGNTLRAYSMKCTRNICRRRLWPVAAEHAIEGFPGLFTSRRPLAFGLEFVPVRLAPLELGPWIALLLGSAVSSRNASQSTTVASTVLKWQWMDLPRVNQDQRVARQFQPNAGKHGSEWKHLLSLVFGLQVC